MPLFLGWGVTNWHIQQSRCFLTLSHEWEGPAHDRSLQSFQTHNWSNDTKTRCIQWRLDSGCDIRVLTSTTRRKPADTKWHQVNENSRRTYLIGWKYVLIQNDIRNVTSKQLSMSAWARCSRSFSGFFAECLLRLTWLFSHYDLSPALFSYTPHKLINDR